MNLLRATFLMMLIAAIAPTPVAAENGASTVQVSNPALDGYYADPSIIFHEGRMFMYATKDPWGGDDLACFSTDDFETWNEHKLNWPTYDACVSETKSTSKVWAPGVIEGRDGRFYMYISVGSEIYAGVADHPAGPWKNMRDDQGPMIKTQREQDIHTIDAAPFIDDDGRIYLYWGSGWNWVNGHCLVVELEPDMLTFKGESKDITPPGYFEAPFMIKRNGRYYLMYSDDKTIDKTYKIRYSVADSPTGPFETEGKNSPILVADEEREVWGPGHHCVFTMGGHDFIAYHRHKRPYEPEPLRRQICFDRLNFDAEGWIETVVPTDEGVRLPVPIGK